MGSLYANDVVRAATAWLGYHEDDDAPNWTIFAKVLDEVGYFAPQQKQGQPWCAIFCDFCCLQAAVPEDRDNEAKKYDAQFFQYQPSRYNYSAGAREYSDYFKDAGAWYDEPKVGDMCFFYVNGTIGHVGIVVDTEDYITTIEGNAGDQVQKKWYSYSDIGGKIAGFGRPRYDGAINPDTADEDNDTAPDPSGDANEYEVSVGSYLAIRTGPSTDFLEVGQLFNGAKVSILEEDGNWARITGGLWVCKDYLYKP